MTQLFANNVSSTLAGSLTSGATSLTVASGQGALYPTPSGGNYFLITLVDAATGENDEIVKCTARSGDVMTIVRAQEGTTAQSWAAGDFVNMNFTAGSASAMVQQSQAQLQSANYAVDTGTAGSMVITLNPAPASMTALLGAPIRVLVAHSNTTTACSININGLGGVSIKLVNSAGVQQPGLGSMAIGKIVELIWDGTQMQYNGQIQPLDYHLIVTGSDNISPITASALANASPYFTSGSGSSISGYQKLTTGTIIQWGRFIPPTGASDPITLPLSYTVGYTLQLAVGETGSGTVVNAVGGTPVSNSGFTISTHQSSGGGWATLSGAPAGMAWLTFGI